MLCGPPNSLHAGLRGNEGFDYLQMSQHGRRKEGWPPAFGDQILGDGTIAHVGSCA